MKSAMGIYSLKEPISMYVFICMHILVYLSIHITSENIYIYMLYKYDN